MARSRVPPRRLAAGRRFARVLIVVFLFAATAVAGAMLGLLAAYQSDIPLIEELEAYEGTATTIVYDREGAEIGQFAVERRIEVEYEELPQHVRDAFVAFEDQRFWQHFGFDPLGIARAIWDNFRAGRIVSGASTITQQVARQLFLNARRRSSGRSRKPSPHSASNAPTARKRSSPSTRTRSSWGTTTLASRRRRSSIWTRERPSCRWERRRC